MAVAAAASIATTELWWLVEQTADLEPIALDDGNPSTMYAIRATVDTGADNQSPSSGGGEVQVTLDLAPRDGTGVKPAQVEVELRSATREGVADSQIITVAPGGPITGYLRLDPWTDCMSRSCTEDFTLTLRRLPAEGDPIVDVTGSIQLSFSAPGASDPPRGAGVVVDVTNLGPVP
jgi:hypothetical protein